MESKFNIDEEVYLKCKVTRINVNRQREIKYEIALPKDCNFYRAECSEADLVKIPEVPKTHDYNIILTVPDVTYKDMLSIYDKLEKAMNDIVGSDDWGMRGDPINEG